MILESNGNSFDIIPKEESRCVWMTAGVLSYMLCDRQYQCETCPTDIAMRRPQKHHQTDRQEIQADIMTTAVRLNTEILYTSNHYWIRTVHPEYLRIGFEPFLANILHTSVGITLPTVGEHVINTSPLGWVIFSLGILPIYPPVDGRVVSVNSTLLSDPRLISKSPLEQGWLLEMTPDSADWSSENILTADHAANIYRHDLQNFRDTLGMMLRESNPLVGPTLMDGGTPLDDISEMLGVDKYIKAVGSIFTKPISRTNRSDT